MNPNEKSPVTPAPTSCPLASVSDSDMDLSAILSLPSPTLPTATPSSPTAAPPAYSALPFRDAEFDFAPILHGKVGDVELETTDGKRFLVHRKVLETETVFFHIYYEFVPAWRLSANAATCANLPPNPHFPNPAHIPATRSGVSRNGSAPAQAASAVTSTAPAQPSALGLTNILSLPRLLTGLCSASQSATPSTPLLVADGQDPSYNAAAPTSHPTLPAPPAKEVTAPTPTTSPYTWSVPEHSSVLLAFLSLIYPPGFVGTDPGAGPASMLVSPEMTAKVIRAAMGYQSTKALNVARDHLSIWVQDRPVDIYAMATFFKFHDLAVLASGYALSVHRSLWSAEAIKMMGRTGAARLLHLQDRRAVELCGILGAAQLERDEHSASCAFSSIIQQLWHDRCGSLCRDIQQHSDLMELFDTELAVAPLLEGFGDQSPCAQCIILFGRTARQCAIIAGGLPRTIL